MVLVNDNEVRCSIGRNLAESAVFPPSSLVEKEGKLSFFALSPTIHPDDVSITTTRGASTGVHPVPETVSKSSSQRMVISAVNVSFQAFIPYSGISASTYAAESELKNVRSCSVLEPWGV